MTCAALFRQERQSKFMYNIMDSVCCSDKFTYHADIAHVIDMLSLLLGVY